MEKYLRINDVIKKIGIRKSTIQFWSKEDKFPKPIKIGLY